MRRLIIAGLVATGTLLALVSSPGCNSGPNNGGPPPLGNFTWGVFAYAMGRNENANASLGVLNNLQGTPLKAGIVVEAAFSSIDIVNPPFGSTRELVVINGVSGTIADQGSAAMADGGEFQRFATDAVRISGTTRHLLFLQGHHGGPLFQVGADTATVNSKLDLITLDGAIGAARTAANLSRFDILVLEMPESATLEVVAIAAKHANFLVAIEGGVPSSGFSETAIVNALKATPGVDAKTLATTIAGSINSPSTPNETPDAVAVVVDLSTAATLVSALAGLGGALNADLNALANAVAAIGSARRDAVEMDIPFGTNVIDAGDFAAKIVKAGTPTGAALTTASVAAANTLTSAIAAALAAPATVGAHYTPAKGLGVFFPAPAAAVPPQYAAAAAALSSASAKWINFLNAYAAKLAAAPTNPTFANFNSPPALMHGASVTIVASVTNAAPANRIHDVTLYITTGPTNNVIFSAPLGPPDGVTGSIVFSQTLNFAALTDVNNSPATPIALARGVRGAGQVFAVEGDMRYTGGATGMADGFLRIEQISGLPLGGFGVFAWTARSASQGNIGRNQTAVPSMATFKVFPRTVTLSNQGVLTATTQTATGYQLAAATGVASLKVNNQAIPAAGPATVWLVARGFDGVAGIITQAVTVQ